LSGAGPLRREGQPHHLDRRGDDQDDGGFEQVVHAARLRRRRPRISPPAVGAGRREPEGRRGGVAGDGYVSEEEPGTCQRKVTGPKTPQSSWSVARPRVGLEVERKFARVLVTSSSSSFSPGRRASFRSNRYGGMKRAPSA